MQHMIEILSKDDNCFMQCLNPLVAVVFALVSEDGQLLQANQGCRRLLNITDNDLPLTKDVRNFLIQPSFAQLLSLQTEAGRPIYAGIINVGNTETFCRSLIGAVYLKGNQLLIVGEYDVAEMEMLNAQVIELNEQLASMQRDLSRSNRKLQESEAQLITMSLTDPLTGLANRRRLMEFLQNEMKRNNRYQEPFSIIMTDIDFFKKVNDGYGHDVGDEVLLAFSKLMQDGMRSIDLVARLGGEEFIIVMPQTTLKDAIQKAERLRAETEQMYFDSMQRGVTASFGVAEFQNSSDVNILLKQVDEAVYASKHGGRNRVTAYKATTG